MVSLLRQSPTRFPDWPNLLIRRAKSVLTGKNQVAIENASHLLARLPLFAELSQAELQFVFDQMRLTQFEPGAVIFASDADSSAMYLIKEGRVNLCTADQSQVEDTRLPGDLLGQTEFLLKHPHSQTAVAVDAVTVWILDEPQLTSIVTTQPNIGLQLGLALGRGIVQFYNYLASQLSKTALLVGLSDVQRRILAQYLTPYRCLPHDIIYRTGDPPTGIFFIERGTVLLCSETEDEYTELSAGDTFGEQAVIYSVPHAFTVEAMSEVTLWLLSPADFVALAGASPSTAATLSHNLYMSLAQAVQTAQQIIDNEIRALELAAGQQHSLVRELRQVRRALTWIKNNQISA